MFTLTTEFDSRCYKQIISAVQVELSVQQLESSVQRATKVLVVSDYRHCHPGSTVLLHTQRGRRYAESVPNAVSATLLRHRCQYQQSHTDISHNTAQCM